MTKHGPLPAVAGIASKLVVRFCRTCPDAVPHLALPCLPDGCAAGLLRPAKNRVMAAVADARLLFLLRLVESVLPVFGRVFDPAGFQFGCAHGPLPAPRRPGGRESALAAIGLRRPSAEIRVSRIDLRRPGSPHPGRSGTRDALPCDGGLGRARSADGPGSALRQSQDLAADQSRQ